MPSEGMENDATFRCRVCGVMLGYAPWGVDGDTPDYSICPCCGVEFGYEDSLPSGVRAFRSRWIAAGTPWFEPALKPVDWDLDRQLELIPQQFL